MDTLSTTIRRLPKRRMRTGALNSASPSIPAIIILIFLTLVPAAFGGGEGLRSGKAALDAGRPAEAIPLLTAARNELPLLGDYALLFLADAYHQLGEHGKALEADRQMIRQFPQSPLLRKARGNEIREARESGDEGLLRLYEAYARDYPEDDDMRMAYASSLKQAGRQSQARDHYKTLCIRAGGVSAAACAELGGRDLSVSDLIERASNLSKRYEFREAERELRKALAADGGGRTTEILRSIGYALFRQKEYREAAAVYAKVHDAYFRARSLYRAGEQTAFEATLAELTAKKDPKAGPLLVAVAADRRRARDFDGALRLYQEILASYPGETEDALWGSGWTLYRSGDFRKAADTFSRLYKTYEDPRYLYWQARSLEALGENAADLYAVLGRAENSYYGALARMQPKGAAARPVSYDADAFPEKSRLDRVEALVSLGMNKEAVSELAFSAKKAETHGAMLYIVSKFHELGEFRRSVGIAAKLPYSASLHRYLYPLAYWNDVERYARRHDVDPYLALSVIREESRFDAEARSVAGARGLMQLMPQTAYRLDKTLRLGVSRESQLCDARTNIQLGVYYLKSLQEEFSSLPQVLAAYNAGELAVRKWMREGRYRTDAEFIEEIPYSETRNYVKKVLTSYFQYRATSPASAGSGPAVSFGSL